MREDRSCEGQGALARRALLEEEIEEADIGRKWTPEPVLTTWIFFDQLLCWAGHPWCTSQAESDINSIVQCWAQLRDQAASILCSLRQCGHSKPSSGLPEAQWLSHAMSLLFLTAEFLAGHHHFIISLLACLVKDGGTWQTLKKELSEILNFFFFWHYLPI